MKQRKILPAESAELQKEHVGPVSRGRASTSLRRRPMIAVACDTCRKKKARCDGLRPRCGRCSAGDQECLYDVAESDTTRSASLKSRFPAVMNENVQLRELIQIFSLAPNTELIEIAARLRTGQDPITVLRQVKEADRVPRAASLNPLNPDASLRDLDCAALHASTFTVPARPWTAVAGDGIVSYLICSWARRDSIFIHPFVDTSCFLRDMRSRDPRNSKYCSPFLVNIICANRAIKNEYAEHFNRMYNTDLSTLFFDEAKRHMEEERGRSSIPTVQGLALVFSQLSAKASDRAGLMFRTAALEMLQTMQLEKKLALLRSRGQGDSEEARVIFKAMWGLFCFDSIVGWAYNQPSLIKPPGFGEPAFQEDAEAPNEVRQNGLIMPLENLHPSQARPASIPGLFAAQCRLSKQLYMVMTYLSQNVHDRGRPKDLQERETFWYRLMQFRAGLPEHLKIETNFADHTVHLSSFIDAIVTRILNLPDPNVAFAVAKDRTMSMMMSPPTVRQRLIDLCRANGDVMDRYEDTFSENEYSAMLMYGAYASAITLVPFLPDTDVHRIFLSAVKLLRRISQYFDAARLVLLAIQARAWELNIPLPEAAKLYFVWDDGLVNMKAQLEDVPTALVLPPYEEVREVLGDEGVDSSELGVKMGSLISKWSAISLG